jgi:hypothetical protein
MFMNFISLVETLLYEDNMAGGAASVFGSGVTSTATAQSGDNYAPKYAITPKSLYGSVISRFGPTKGKSKSHKKGSKKRSKQRKQWI